MRCISPRTVGFKADGRTISFSLKNINKEYATFQLPCGKCLECRLEYARQWAIRCVHEAQMHPENCFVTLTYNNENLKSERLQYIDFQLFVKRLRSKIFRDFLSTYGKENWKLLTKAEQKTLSKQFQISIFVTGEYGEKNKRPHWHACIFNYTPTDPILKYTSDRGDRVYESETLSQLWGHGLAEYGQVTLESAGYCARYAAKKLVHGKDEDHNFHPISKKSSHQAIGKTWIEKYYLDVFNYGNLILPDGKTCAIPRYYEKWLKKNQPDLHSHYVTQTKLRKIEHAQKKMNEENLTHHKNTSLRGLKGATITRSQARYSILKQKFKMLQNNLKL